MCMRMFFFLACGFRQRHFRTFYWIVKLPVPQTWLLLITQLFVGIQIPCVTCDVAWSSAVSVVSVMQCESLLQHTFHLFSHLLIEKSATAEQEALVLFSGRHSHNTVVSAEFHCIRQMLQGFAGKSTVSKNTCRSICSVALVYAVLVFAAPTSTDQRRGHISNVKREYFWQAHSRSWIFRLRMSSTDVFVRQNVGIFVAVRTDALKTAIFLVQLTEWSF